MDYPLHDLQSICSEFGIGGFISVEGKLGGYVNTNIKIKTENGFFVIRIYREKVDPGRIHYAHATVSTLRSSNLPALMPLPNKLGSYFSTRNEYFISDTIRRCASFWVASDASLFQREHAAKHAPNPYAY